MPVKIEFWKKFDLKKISIFEKISAHSVQRCVWPAIDDVYKYKYLYMSKEFYYTEKITITVKFESFNQRFPVRAPFRLSSNTIHQMKWNEIKSNQKNQSNQ